jgi:NADPH:quinone reductase-like Zn-dependent oxidoreductase
VILRAAADGSGPVVGTRIVALTDELGWAEQVAVPSHRIVELPDNVSFAQAATLPVAGLTALRCLRLGGPLVGRRVLVTGAAGGVGTLAIQIAVRSGAKVTAVVGTSERAIGLSELGVHDVVDGIANASGRYSVILESAGGISLSQAVDHIEPNGTIVVFGNSSGERSTISFQDFRPAQNSHIVSFFYFTSGPEEMFAPDIALLVSLIADGSLKPVIGMERDWVELATVAEMLRDRRFKGKAVFHTAAW